MSFLFLKALKGEPLERFPVWLMRQAGRYMPQYRELRRRAASFLDFCSNVELAVEVTLLPERLLGVDALILFSDILVPLTALGVEVNFVEGRGPVLKTPERFEKFHPQRVDYVFEIIKRVKERSELPLIGFGGAPFTLAAYLVEGKTSRDFMEIRRLFYSDRRAFEELLTLMAEMLKEYLSAQIEAGVDAVQLFDSWAYVMSPEMFEVYKPVLEELISHLKGRHPGVPIIYFARGSGHLLKSASELPADAFSVDWTVKIEEAFRKLEGKAVQGNLDPAVLYSDEETLRETVRKFLKRVSELRKTLYVFNLGHGLAPDMDLNRVKLLVKTVKEFRLHDEV